MNETRVQSFNARLQPMLRSELPPDAAGSKALVLALLAAQAEADVGGGPADTPAREKLMRDIQLLPAFIVQEEDRGSTDSLPELVRRFVQGERLRATPILPGPHAAQAAGRHARLRELQRWGVDLSLVENALAQTPAARIANMERQLVLVRQLQQATRQSAFSNDLKGRDHGRSQEPEH